MMNFSDKHLYHQFTPSEAMVSNEVTRVIEVIFDLTLSFIVSFTGMITNTVVIVVFTRLGFKDSVSVSMTTIAVWDLVKSIVGTMRRMRGPISIWFPAQAESWNNISLAICSYLVSIDTYVTSSLAAYVAVERCLCITMPHKTKWLLTPRVSLTVCLVLSITVFGWFAVVFGMYDIVWVFSPQYNQTVAMYQFSHFATNNTVFYEYYNLSGILWPLVSLFTIVVSTIIISYKLRKMSVFRSKQMSPQEQQIRCIYIQSKGMSIPPTQDSSRSLEQITRKMSQRDQRVIKMLLVIIVIYIICLTPRETIYITKYFHSEFYFLRKYHNSFITMVYIELFFDYINGTVNLFVFLKMSSTFRAAFTETFPSCCKLARLKVSCASLWRNIVHCK